MTTNDRNSPRARHRWRSAGSLIPVWTVREIRVQYRQSVLDLGWTLLTPVITLIGFGFVLTRAFAVDGDGIPYLVFAWTGIVVWTFFANGLSRGASSLVHSAELVRKIPFPKVVVPISVVLASGVDLAIGLAVTAVLMVVQDVGVSVTAVALVPVAAVTLVWTVAMTIILAVLTSFVRDVAHALSVTLRIGIFVTPVMYPPSQFPEQYRWVMEVNPVAVFIEATRDALLRHLWPNWTLLGLHGAVAAAMLVIALAYVHRVEGRIADVI